MTAAAAEHGPAGANPAGDRTVLHREDGGGARISVQLARLRNWLVRLPRWRRHLAALLLGMAATAALPPVFALPLLIPAFAGFLWLVEGAENPKQAALVGFAFGLGHFTSGLYWIAYALLTDPERYGWFAPFAPLSLAALFAIYPAGAAILSKVAFRFASERSGVYRVIVFAAAWSIGEWLRGHAMTGFAWNLTGTVWGVSESMMQSVALFGTYGLGFVTVLAAAMPAVLGEGGENRKYVILAVAAPYLLLAVLWTGGYARLVAAGPTQTVANTTLRLIQPDVAQGRKWRDELRLANLRRDLDLTKAAARESDSQSAVFVIWPETAVPFLVDQDAAVRSAIATVVPKGGLVITGAPRATPVEVEPFKVWNGVVAVDGQGAVVGSYDKFHLVPFGEYLPFRSLLPKWLHLDKLTPGATDFSAGPGPQTLHLPGLPPVGPLICYEIIFPHAVADENDRPGLFINVTNDAWFGISSGPYQHFESARFRAIEEGIPVARAANTGISGVIDPFGRIISHLGLGRDGAIDSPLPRAQDRMPPYARFGDLIPLLLIVAALLIAIPARRIG